MEMPPLHHDLRHHVDHLDFMLYSTQQEADRAHQGQPQPLRALGG
jgi:hypothetical protein